jgi:apolipoprotein D and lipocalin family protein
MRPAAFVLSLILSAAALAGPAQAIQPITEKLELTKMTGRWYEVARLPNKIQKDCQAATSDWARNGDGYSVVQTCHKGQPGGPKQEWRAKAQVADPATNARFKMSFFGGLVNQEYWVLDHRPDQGWLLLGTPSGRGLWLMSQRPSLTGAVKAQAIARVRQLGYDVSRLEFPQQRN